MDKLQETISKLNAIEMSQDDITAVLEPYCSKIIPLNSSQGKLISRQRKNGIIHLSLQFYKKRIFELQQLKKKENVRNDYDLSYKEFDFAGYGFPPGRKPGRHFLGDQVLELYSSGPKLLSTLMIEKILSQLNVASVCECGTGTGRNLMYLASKNKDMGFIGFDYSRFAIETANNAFNQSELALNLPGDISGLITESEIKEISDRLKFICCSADNIKMQDKSVDVLFTSAALEQMWEIRDEVFKEIHRVTRKYVIFYEPFWDGNDFFGRLFLRSGNYFRYRQSDIEKFGFKILKSFNLFPTKPTFNYSMVVAKVV